MRISSSQATTTKPPSVSLPKFSSSQPSKPLPATIQPVKRIIPKNAVVLDLTLSSDVEPDSDNEEFKASYAQSKQTVNSEFKAYELGCSSLDYTGKLQTKPKQLDQADEGYQANDADQAYASKKSRAKISKFKRHTMGIADSPALNTHRSHFKIDKHTIESR